MIILFIFSFWLGHMASGMSSQPEIELTPALEAWVSTTGPPGSPRAPVSHPYLLLLLLSHPHDRRAGTDHPRKCGQRKPLFYLTLNESLACVYTQVIFLQYFKDVACWYPTHSQEVRISLLVLLQNHGDIFGISLLFLFLNFSILRKHW